jgi:hypothetical protein
MMMSFRSFVAVVAPWGGPDLVGGFYSDSARAHTGHQSLVLFRNIDDYRDSSI